MVRELRGTGGGELGMDENGIGVPYWWIHHDPRLPDGRICPLEFTGEPIECRLAYIRNSKPPRETPTRERWMRPVIGALPLDVVRAGKAFAATQKVFTWISAPMPWINLQKGQEISEARANAHVVLDSILTE